MTKAQQVYERIDALVEAGTKKADAFRQLADELGQPVKSVQGAYYQHSRKANGGSTNPRKRETTTTDAVGQAVIVLEKAIAAIDIEVKTAGSRADEAKAEYEALMSSAADRKKAITAKIQALRA